MITDKASIAGSMESFPDNAYSLIQCAEDLILVLNEGGDYVYANPAALEIVGCRLEDLQGGEVGRCAHASDLLRLARWLCATQPGERQLLEWQCGARTGARPWLSSAHSNFLTGAS